jgi:hypothetical protein
MTMRAAVAATANLRNIVMQKHPRTSVSIKGLSVKMTIDTGSSINVIYKNTFAKLRNIELKQTSVKAYPFNSDKPVKMEGKSSALAESKHKFTVATMYVTSEDSGCILSTETAQELGLVSLHLNQIRTPPQLVQNHHHNSNRIQMTKSSNIFWINTLLFSVDWVNSEINRLN